MYDLTEREKTILRYIIQQFILTANPVGSRNLFKKYEVGLSPASIRNIMSDLEESGYLGHPHTSAGRVPTDKGYRFYVDSLMEPPRLGREDREFIDSEFEAAGSNADELLKITSFVLSNLTNQLACVTYPNFSNAILERLQIVSLSSTRIMVVLSIKSGMVNTITLEIKTEVKPEQIQTVERLLNERLAGLKLSEIKSTLGERIKDYYSEEYIPIIRVFIDSADKIFTDSPSNDKSIITGAKNILRQPEFGSYEHFQSIIELMEDKDVIIHIMDEKRTIKPAEVTILIGSETENDRFGDYSIITREYKVGRVTGKLGIVGPKRMEYSKAVAAVVYVAETLSKELKKISD